MENTEEYKKKIIFDLVEDELSKEANDKSLFVHRRRKARESQTALENLHKEFKDDSAIEMSTEKETALQQMFRVLKSNEPEEPLVSINMSKSMLAVHIKERSGWGCVFPYSVLKNLLQKYMDKNEISSKDMLKKK